MKIAHKYLSTLLVLLILLITFTVLDVHYSDQIKEKNAHITQLNRPIEIKQQHTLTGKVNHKVSPYTLSNSNEQRQIDFAKDILTTRFTYSNADTYANNRAKLQKQIAPKLWERVKNNEFSDQKNRIGQSNISMTRSTSNFISADAYIEPNTFPEHNMGQEDVPIYYLVTTSYTNNKNNNANSGKQSFLIKMQVNATKSLVDNYQIITTINDS